MIAVVDADYLVYSMAAWAQDNQANQFEMIERIEENLEEWLEKAGCEHAVFAFSCSREDNFRRDAYPPYKTNRTAEAPAMLRAARKSIESVGKTITLPKLEADDIMGILGTGPRAQHLVLISSDKDLRTIPGWHLNPRKDEAPVRVGKDEAFRLFLLQWLTGDTVDGYRGIKGVGPAKAEKILNQEGGPSAQLVVEAYLEAGYTYEEAQEQAVCARILQSEDWDSDTKQVIPMDLRAKGWYTDES